MSTNDRAFDDAIAEAKSLLENHDDAEYDALEPSQKANYQEALEFLSRLESTIEPDGGRPIEDAIPDVEIELETDLESTMGDDGSVVGPFGGHDVVVYDPDDGEQWISMDYDATVSLENMQ